jgi:hypothetical protein
MNKKFLYITFSVIVILLGIVIFFAIGRRSEQANNLLNFNQNTLKTLPINQTAPPNQFANWKTYNNTRYNYTIKYPSNWFVDTVYSENDFTARGPDNELIGGDTIFANYPNYSSYNLENPGPNDSFPVTLMIYKIEPSVNYEKFISTQNFSSGIKENIIINGLTALKLTGSNLPDNPPGLTVVSTFLKVGEKMFVFNYSGNPIPQTEKEIANNIIGSLIVK